MKKQALDLAPRTLNCSLNSAPFQALPLGSKAAGLSNHFHNVCFLPM